MMYQLRFQGVEERLHGRIVERITLAAHTARHVCRLDQFAVIVCGIFDALVGVEDTSGNGSLSRQCHAQCALCELRVTLTTKRPAHHLATEQIQYHGMVEPAGTSLDISKVSGPM